MEIPLPSPYDDDRLRAFLASRAIPGVESVTGAAGNWRYARSLRDGSLTIAVRGGRVRVDGPGDLAVRLLDLDPGRDPSMVDWALAQHPVLAPLVARRPGLRVPGAADPHELAFRAVLGQQISVSAASTMAGRIAEVYGDPIACSSDAVRSADRSNGVRFRFPSAERLAEVSASDYQMARQRGRTMHALAQALASGTVDLSPDSDPANTRTSLMAIPGIGPWTAGYITMRACGDPDVLLDGDLIVRRSAAALGLPGTARGLSAWAADIAPWRSYLTMHLWAAYSPHQS